MKLSESLEYFEERYFQLKQGIYEARISVASATEIREVNNLMQHSVMKKGE